VKRPAARLALLVLAFWVAPATAGAKTDSPRVIRVRTEPAVAGITLTLEGRRYVTDSEGRVRIPRPRGVAATAVLPRITVGSRNVGSRTVVRFARWFRVGPDAVAALDVFRRVDWRFSDTTGAVVPPGKIGRLVLRSTTGEVRVWRTRLGRSHLLFSRRVTLIGGRLVPKNVRYSVQRVTVLGTDVVSSGQQTFVPQRERVVRFTLAFFTLTVRGEDALFGSAAGTRARLELPDGSRRELRLVHGQAVIPSLPRGTYRITLEDGVYRMSQPLVLSRSQVAVVPVVTYLDLIAVGGGLLVAALGLLLIGRPYLARRAAARITLRRPSPGEQAESS
jgi:hypothetical protein